MALFRSIEICAGAGGQAIGLESAGFKHAALIEIDKAACETLRLNRPAWNVIEGDVRQFSGAPFMGVELLAGGVPCPPFSIAGKQLGAEDERDLFPEMIRLAQEIEPQAILVENVRGLLGSRFDGYRNHILQTLWRMGYMGEWRLVDACNFGVPQTRARAVLAAMRRESWPFFQWPAAAKCAPSTVGEVLYGEMAQRGWRGAQAWREQASRIAPTLVGGSRKHGGPDLGPTRARQAWAHLGVDGLGVADEPPGPDFSGMPRLTVQMAALLQGFPKDWRFYGGKTAAYRQVGNAFPPPVAEAIGRALHKAVNRNKQHAKKASKKERLPDAPTRVLPQARGGDC